MVVLFVLVLLGVLAFGALCLWPDQIRRYWGRINAKYAQWREARRKAAKSRQKQKSRESSHKREAGAASEEGPTLPEVRHPTPPVRRYPETSTSRLIRCPDCGMEISKSASACPYCGWRTQQAVTIERPTDESTIGKYHRCRSIPGLHDGRVIFIERAFVCADVITGPERLRDHHHHRMR